MQWVTIGLAVYGAAVSTALAYLAWRKDRHSIRFLARLVQGHRGARLEIAVVNAGFRAVALESAHFEVDRGGAYLPTPR